MAADNADPRDHRPKVLWLADRRGWAYDHEGHAVARAVADEFAVEIAYVREEPDLARAEFDLLCVAFWGETWHQRFAIPAARVLKQVASHRWQLEPAWGPLSPAEFVARHLGDAGTVTAISRRLHTLLSPHRTVHFAPQSVEVERFARAAPRRGPIVFGWAGNADDPCKGLRDVLLPAAGRDFVLRIAGGELDARAMVDFYRSIDVLCIASMGEGGPLPLLEGMASGCYVLATDVGTVPELVQHGVHGQIVARTPLAFALAMAWCCDHPDEVRRAGMQNEMHVATLRGSEVVAPLWRSTLRVALAQTKAARAAEGASTARSNAVAGAKAGYAAHYATMNAAVDDEGAYRAAEFYYRAELASVLPPAVKATPSRALDVGAGRGLLMRFLRETGCAQVDGVELNADLHAVASAALPAGSGTLVHADAVAWLAATPARYHLLTAYDIVEHFDLDGALAFATAARAVLAPGGRAVFRTPNMANVLGVYSRYIDLTHQVGFTEQSLTQLLRLAGFARCELVVPEFDANDPLGARLLRARTFHRELFELQDRAMPRCFDKNLVMVAHV